MKDVNLTKKYFYWGGVMITITIDIALMTIEYIFLQSLISVNYYYRYTEMITLEFFFKQNFKLQ